MALFIDGIDIWDCHNDHAPYGDDVTTTFVTKFNISILPVENLIKKTKLRLHTVFKAKIEQFKNLFTSDSPTESRPIISTHINYTSSPIENTKIHRFGSLLQQYKSMNGKDTVVHHQVSRAPAYLLQNRSPQ